MVRASASAKTILFGEHAVVYGEPAVAIPLKHIRTFVEMKPNQMEFRVISPKVRLNSSYENLRPGSAIRKLLDLLVAELSLRELPRDTMYIKSRIPIASGLGSGAALSTAIIRAMFIRCGRDPEPETVNRLAFEIEKIYHGTPSGVDNTTIAYEQPICFTKGEGFTPLQADLSHLHLLVVDTGIRSKTSEVVSDVRLHYEENKQAIQEIGALVRQAAAALGTGSAAEIGRLMNENQRLLQAINVSCPELDTLIGRAISQGALGAKLTGAGRGGNFLVLARDAEHAGKLKKIYEEQGLKVH